MVNLQGFGLGLRPLARLRARYPIWNRFVIPANTYPGQTEPIRTLSQPNVLATTATADEEVIYLVVKAIWTNLDYLHRQHAATRVMTLDHAIAGMPLLLHPGAIRFFRGAGLTITEELLPPEMRTLPSP